VTQGIVEYESTIHRSSDEWLALWEATFSVTSYADSIRKVAGRDMNMCHEVMSTVMQPHRVYNKHNELLQSCYWKLKVNPTYGADLAHWTYFWASDTTL
jgi:hypothetical protein